MENFILELKQIAEIDREIVGKEIIELAILEKEKIFTSPSLILTNAGFLNFLSREKIISKLEKRGKVKDVIKESMLPESMAKKILAHYHRLAGGVFESEIKLTPYLVYEDKEKQLPPVILSGESNLILEIKNIWTNFLETSYISFSQNYTSSTPKIVILMQKFPKNAENGYFSTLKRSMNKKTIEITLKNKKNISQKVIWDKTYNKFISNFKNKKNENIFNNILALSSRINKLLYLPKKVNFYIKNENIYITSILDESSFLEEIRDEKDKKILLKGEKVNPGIVSGNAIYFNKLVKLSKNILILDFFGREDIRFIEKAIGIIITKKENLSLLSNLQIPIVFTPDVKSKIKNEDVVTINGTTGEIFKGGYIAPILDKNNIYKTATKVILNLKDKNIGNEILNLSDMFFYDNTLDLASFIATVQLTKPKTIIYNLNNNNLETTVSEIKTLRNKEKLSNISISISDANSLDDIMKIKQTIASSGLYRNHTFKEYLYIKNIFLCMATNEIKTLGIDGIILDLKTLNNLFFNDTKTIQKDNLEFDNFIINTIKSFSLNHIPVFIDDRILKISNSFLHKLMENSLTGIMSEKIDFIDNKIMLKTIEKKLLE